MNQHEEKLIQLQKEKEESDKRLLNIEIVLGIITLLSFLTILFSALFIIYQFKTYTLPILMIAIATLIFVTGAIFCILIEQKAGYYHCRKCGHKHVPTFKQVFLAMHIFRTRYMKCPHCNKKSWQKKIIEN